MPLYYFHNSERDDTGLELADDDAAREVAMETFGQYIRELSIDGSGATSQHMRVVEGTRAVLTLSFLASAG